MALEAEGMYPPKKTPPKAGEFKPASDVKIDDWEKSLNLRFNNLVRLGDYALLHAKENCPEGWGFSIDVEIDGLGLKITTAPPSRSGGGGWDKKQQPPFDTAKVEGLVAEYPDKLKLTREGGKVQISSEKYPGEDVVAKLKASGLRWNGNNKKWEQP